MKSRHTNRMMVLLLILCLFGLSAMAQHTLKPREAFLEAESYFLYEEFSDALPLYVQLKEQFPDNYNLSYKIGRCYLSLPYERQKSIIFLEDAVNHCSSNSRANSLKELKAPSDALFYLGDAYRVNNRLAEAINAYKTFKAHASNEIYDLSLVNHEIEACERAIIMEKRAINVSATNLGALVNTRFSETNPVITPDETTMVYATRLPFYQAMFYARKVNGKWSDPINMIPELGIDGDCFPTSISPDGTELYLYRCNEYLGDLYVTNFRNGKWTKIRRLNGNINTRYYESHACISPDGKTLYFTSNRKGGYGGLDIYKSTRTSTTTDNWGPAVNLGPVINSEYNEDSPFLTADGKRLYFSSFGHQGMGGYDIFYSDLTHDDTWGEPVNLGYPVNTTDDETFFNPVKDGSVAYMAKFDPGGFGRFDLYRYEISRNPQKAIVSGKVKIPHSIAGEVRLCLYDRTKKDTTLQLMTTNGTFSFETKPGNFELQLSCDGCESKTVALLVPEGTIEKSIDIILSPGNTIALIQASPAKPNDSAQRQEIRRDDHSSGDEPVEPDSATMSQTNVSPKDTLAISNRQTSDSPGKGKKEIATTPGSNVSLSMLYLLALGTVGLSFILFIIIKRRRQKEKES